MSRQITLEEQLPIRTLITAYEASGLVLLRRGFGMAAIMRAGDWKSVNVLARYLENAEHNVWA